MSNVCVSQNEGPQQSPQVSGFILVRNTWSLRSVAKNGQ